MAQKRILIVDDEKLVRWALTQKCTEFGYQTVEAENGEEAIRSLQSDSVDAVLLDVHLPDLSGIEVLEKLKQAGETRSVIMMTADPQLDDLPHLATANCPIDGTIDLRLREVAKIDQSQMTENRQRHPPWWQSTAVWTKYATGTETPMI